MISQDIVDEIDSALSRCRLDARLREQILNAAYSVLSDNREEPNETD